MLTYLLENVDPDYVSQLDPFPEVAPLVKLCDVQSALRQRMVGVTLATEIERFMSVGVYSSRTEGLRALGRLLHNSKFEFSSLIEQGTCIEEQQYSLCLHSNLVSLWWWCVGCHGDSVMLMLVQGLLGLSQRLECGQETDCEVARCLGEVGPTDFRCIALPSANHQSEQ